jgi:hypothetical protein
VLITVEGMGVRDPQGSSESSEAPEAERDAVIKARRGQGKFRIDVIPLWGSCAIKGCSLSKV